MSYDDQRMKVWEVYEYKSVYHWFDQLFNARQFKYGPTQLNSIQPNPTQTNATQFNPIQLNSIQPNPTQLNLTQSPEDTFYFWKRFKKGISAKAQPEKRYQEMYSHIFGT